MAKGKGQSSNGKKARGSAHPHLCHLLFAICLLNFFSSSASAQDHKLFDWKNVALQGVNIAAQTADFVSTDRALQIPGTREANPLMQSQSARVAVKVSAVALCGLSAVLAAKLHSSGHHRLERVLPLIYAAPSAAAAAHNFSIRPRP